MPAAARSHRWRKPAAPAPAVVKVLRWLAHWAAVRLQLPAPDSVADLPDWRLSIPPQVVLAHCLAPAPGEPQEPGLPRRVWEPSCSPAAVLRQAPRSVRPAARQRPGPVPTSDAQPSTPRQSKARRAAAGRGKFPPARRVSASPRCRVRVLLPRSVLLRQSIAACAAFILIQNELRLGVSPMPA